MLSSLISAAHCVRFCRITAFWQDRGFSGRGSGLFGGSILWPPVSGDQSAEQRGGAGVVRWPLWGAQEKEFLPWREEAAGKDHAGVSGEPQQDEDDSLENTTKAKQQLFHICVFLTVCLEICRNLTIFSPPSLQLWSVMEEKEQRAWWVFSMSFSISRPTLVSLMSS